MIDSHIKHKLVARPFITCVSVSLCDKIAACYASTTMHSFTYEFDLFGGLTL